jgi:proline iminopeptidase
MNHVLRACSASLALVAMSLHVAAAGRDRRVEVEPGVTLFVHEEGRGAPTVVVHGGPGLDSNYLAADLAPLARSRRLIFYDQRGSGRSTLRPDVTADRLVADLERLRTKLDLPRMALLGHSWGAGLAALYASKYPARVTRLVLVDAIPLTAEETALFGQALRSRLSPDEEVRLRDAAAARDLASTEQQHVDACRAYWDVLIRAYYAEPAAASRSKGQMCAASGAALANGRLVIQSVFGALDEFDWRGQMSSLAVPTLVVHGDKDPIPLETAREWRQTLRNARLLVLPNAGHMSYVEQPEAFFAAVGTFLSGRSPKDAQ